MELILLMQGEETENQPEEMMAMIISQEAVYLHS